jgi:hypothetical protein
MNQQPGFFTKLLTLLASVVVLIVGLMFSVLFLAVVAAVGLVVWGYFWWKTRELRKVMREQQPGEPFGRSGTGSGYVVDGEATVVEGEFTQVRVTLPHDPSRDS